MKNRIMLFLAAFALATGVAAISHAATNSTAKVGKQQGGDRFYVASGGELDVESGGALKIAGTTMSCTAAELNTLASVVAGTTSASKALVVDSNKKLDTLVISDGGLKLGSGAGTAVTSTAAELNQVAVGSQTTSGLSAVKVARFTWDCGNGSGCPVGATPLDASLPAHAIIIRSWFRITTQFADTGTCTAALSCEDANNIKTATDITGSAAGAIVEGQSTGAASAFIQSIASPCTITGTIADGGACVPSAGKLTGWVMYVTHD